MIGTLTLSILKSVHTSISPIIFYKLCSVATPRHLEPLPLENHVRIVALTSDLQRVSFYSVTEFLHQGSTTELIPSLILIKGSHPSPKASLLCRKSSVALWLLRAKRPRTSHNSWYVGAACGSHEAFEICLTYSCDHTSFTTFLSSKILELVFSLRKPIL
jgi:hypothetical protein